MQASPSALGGQAGARRGSQEAGLGLPFDRSTDSDEENRTNGTANVNTPQPVDGGPDKAAITALIRAGKYEEARMLLARSQQQTGTDEQGAAAASTQQPASGGGATGPHPGGPGPSDSIPLVLPPWAEGNKALLIRAARNLLEEGNGPAAVKLLKTAGLTPKDILESSDQSSEAPPSRYKRRDRKGPLGRVKLAINPAFDQQSHGGVQGAPGAGASQGAASLAGPAGGTAPVVRPRSRVGGPVQSSGADGQGPVQQSGGSAPQGPAQQPRDPAGAQGTDTHGARGGPDDTGAPSGAGGLSGAGGSGGPDRPGGPGRPSGPGDAAPLSSALLRARQDALYGPENFRFLIRDPATRDRTYLFESANGQTGYLLQSSHGPQIGPVSEMVRYISFGSREEATQFMQQATGRPMSAILARGAALGHVGMTPPPPAGSVVVTFGFSSQAPNALLVESSVLPGEVAPDSVREQVRSLVKGLYEAMRRKLDRDGQ